MQKIIYLREPVELLNALNLDYRIEEFLEIKDCFDYAGGIYLSKERVSKAIKTFSSDISDFIKEMGNAVEGNIYFRSKKYYLNYVLSNNVDLIRKKIPEYLIQTSNIIDSLSNSKYCKNLENKLLIAAVLDLKKHYSLCIMNSHFKNMLRDGTNKELYVHTKNECIKDIFNFYNFILNDELSPQGKFSKDLLDVFERKFILPKNTLPTLNKPKGETAARKLIVREMDHPMQIMLFAGQILDQDKSGKIDFIVNPLSGAIEIGYAVRCIYEALNIEKIEDIFLIKYLRYGENDSYEESLEKFIPSPSLINLENLKEKRLFVVDDNIFSGQTLYDLKKIFVKYSNKIGIAAIERKSDSKKKPVLNYDDLDIKPISKLRYIERVLNFIRNYNLKGIVN